LLALEEETQGAGKTIPNSNREDLNTRIVALIFFFLERDFTSNEAFIVEDERYSTSFEPLEDKETLISSAHSLYFGCPPVGLERPSTGREEYGSNDLISAHQSVPMMQLSTLHNEDGSDGFISIVDHQFRSWASRLEIEAPCKRRPHLIQ
jgi:hypothetical protein